MNTRINKVNNYGKKIKLFFYYLRICITNIHIHKSIILIIINVLIASLVSGLKYEIQ